VRHGLTCALVALALAGCSQGSRETPTLRASLEATRAFSFPLHEATLLGQVYVFLEAADADATAAVEFSLRAVGGAVLWQEARGAPFDLMGTEDGRGRPWNTQGLDNGRYLLRAQARLLEGGSVEVDAEFTIANAPRDGAANVWQPVPGTTWQWQLTGTVDTSVDAEVFDIDLFDTPAGTVAELQGAGRRVICYFSAGSFEAWRPDADLFTTSVIGNRMEGWPEDWLDIRRIDDLAPIMRARLDLAAEKGCDAVEPDNVDAYLSDTGFPLTAADQVRYLRFLSEEARARGLAIGLKNALELIPELLNDVDFAVNEECYRWDECDRLRPFVMAGKAVFGAEYGIATDDFCPVTNALGLDFILKRRDLGTYREGCR
jgi:hypothetical protein